MSRSILSRRFTVARAGFTIVELLVATAITLVVLGLMVQISFSVLGTFDKVTGTVTARTQASTVLRFLREDFQSIVWRRDGNVWLLATVQPDQVGAGQTGISDADWDLSGAAAENPKPGRGALGDYGKDLSSLRFDEQGSTGKWIDLKEHRFGQAGVWLRFFTNRTTTSSDGDVAPIAVSYQIVRMPPRSNSDEYRYLFFRSQVRSGRETTANPYSVADAGFNLALNAQGGYNRPNTPVATKNDAFGDSGSIRKPDRDAVIANNVIDFGVRFWRRVPPGPTDPATDPSTLQLMFPASGVAPFAPSENNLGFAVTALTPAQLDALNGGVGIPDDGNLAPANLSTGFPDFVDIFVRVLTDEGARLIEAYERGNLEAPPGSDRKAHWWKIAEEHSEVFTERIPIAARPI